MMMKYMIAFEANMPVATSVRQALSSSGGRPGGGRIAAHGPLFFDFLRRLPEKQIRRNTAIDLYNQWLKKAGGGTAPTTLGVESFSAGLLFAKVAGNLGSHLTRDNLITGLSKVTSWDAGGLHPSQNPSKNIANSCVLYLQVKGGKFVRAFPDKGFSCNTANTAHVSGDFGKVPVDHRVSVAQFLQYTILGLAAAGVYTVAGGERTGRHLHHLRHLQLRPRCRRDVRGLAYWDLRIERNWPAPLALRSWCCSCWRPSWAS